MKLLFKILIVIAVHTLIFLSYPETGNLGEYYLAISIILWSGFIMFINLSVKIVKFISGILGHALNIAVFVVMTMSIAITMPQSDRVSVLEKIQEGQYPSKETFKTGLRKLGLTKDNMPKIPTDKIKNKISENLRNTLDKIDKKDLLEEVN